MKKNILFTDIVGYSTLTGNDQSLALELLNEHDKIIEPIISRYKGNIVKRIGDAIVAIFDDTKNMIQASIEVQQSLKNRNNRNIKSRQLVLRIGLHYGEVFTQGNEVYGKGYDLASEIEPICEYGGIAISEAVYLQSHEDNELIVQGVNNHFFIHPIAEFKFKSNATPVLIYKLYLNLLDWYDELYTNTSNYLEDQNVPDDKYNNSNLDNYHQIKFDTHLDLAESFLKKHNISYAIYHYKIYLDYCPNPNIAIKLKILKIFAECGLIRLVNKAFDNNNFDDTDLAKLVLGINLFNEKKWDDAIVQFELFLDYDNSSFTVDSLYYLIISLFKKQHYGRILELIDNNKNHFSSSNFHFSIINIIHKMMSFYLNNDISPSSIEDLYSDFELKYVKLDSLNKRRYILFLHYLLIEFHQKNTISENAINIQNKAIKIIKDCESSISGFLLRQLFFKNPVLHQIIMEPLELEFADDEGLDDLDLDDVLIEQKDVSKFCTSCGSKNSFRFQFCTSCGEKLIS
tara:strand:- start:22 stop:1566 length:1545 start_codon:yes stop_codon:yes gene_type:complete